MKSSTQKNPK